MLRACAAVMLLALVACGTGQSEGMSAPAGQQPAPQAAEPEAAASAAARPGLPPPPPPPPPAEGEKPAATSGAVLPDGEAPKLEEQSTGKPRDKKRVFAAVVKGLQGSLTEEQVTKTVATAKDNLHACFANEEARVEVSLQISGSGSVGDAGVIRSDPVDARKTDCVVARLSKLKFPPPGQSLKLELAIYLEPK